VDKKKLKEFEDHLVNRLLFWQGKGLKRTSHAEHLLGEPMVNYSSRDLQLIQMFITDLDYLLKLYGEAVKK